jgi:predicted enzyme related to lactoylglutathione lyase
MQFVVLDLQGILQRILPMGAIMDGPIQFEKAGRILAIRNPDGHMMSLFEPNS